MYKNIGQLTSWSKITNLTIRWVIWLCCLVVPVTSAKTLVITTGEWAPLISEQAGDHGPISAIVKESFALSGIKVEFRFFPWKRAMQEIRAGRAVGSSAWRKTPERVEEFLFSDGVYDNQNVFFHLKNKRFNWQEFKDLKQYYIGAALGYAYSEAFQKSEESGDFEVFRVNKEKSLVNMLLTGRIDAFPANREVGLQLINSQSPEAFSRFAIHPKPLSSKPLHLILKKGAKGRALLKRFNDGLLQLKQSGRFEEIYGKGPQ